MTGQLCGRCGTALAPEGCPCGWSGSDEETAVIPMIGGPELVRPYFRPDSDGPDADDPDADGPDTHDPDADDQVFDAEIVEAELLDSAGRPGVRAAAATAAAGTAQATRVLPAYLPAQRSTEQLGSLLVTRPPQGAGPVAGRGRRRPKATRSTVLIAAGIALIAGIGVAAALVPKLLGGGQVNIAQPLPEVTAPLPSQAPTSHSARPSPSAPVSTQGAPVAPTTQAATRSAAPPPTRTSAPPSAGPTATASATAPTSPTASPTASTGSGSGSSADETLSLGDSGPAVVTLQQDLADIWDQYLPANGVYNRRTELDVATFQQMYGVQGDPMGVYGPNTRAAMAQVLSQQNNNQQHNGW